MEVAGPLGTPLGLAQRKTGRRESGSQRPWLGEAAPQPEGPKHTWRGAGGSIGHDSLLSAARLRPATRSSPGLGAPGRSAPPGRSAHRHLAWLVKAWGYQLLSRRSRSARRGPLTSCGAAGPPGAVLRGPCPGRLAQPRVGLRGGDGAAGD